MERIKRLLAANAEYAKTRPTVNDSVPSLHIAVVTCMDARIDVFAALGLKLGELHVIRNAGGRVTDDVLRSLALSSNVLDVDTVVVMEHTRCGLEGAQEELAAKTGADLEFLTIDDHAVALKEDIETLRSTPYLDRVHTIVGLLYDVDTGAVRQVV